MADIETTTPRPPLHIVPDAPRKPGALTSTERSRRSRQRAKLKAASPVTVATTAAPVAAPAAAVATPVAAPTALRPGRGVAAATLVAALALAACSAIFSISGLTSIFAGATVAVICLGIAFELGKLSAVAWLGRHGSGALGAALVTLVAVLMVLNSIGVYGFLSRAHLEHGLAGDLIMSSAAATVDARLDAKQADLDDLKTRIAQLDQTKTVATKGRTMTTTVGDQGPARDRLVQQREAAESAIADLRIERAKVDGERKAVEADLGPVRYLASLLGSTDEATMRHFILIVALLLDPAAVLLLLAATHGGRL